jgi:hypothetical protein
MCSARDVIYLYFKISAQVLVYSFATTENELILCDKSVSYLYL